MSLFDKPKKTEVNKENYLGLNPPTSKRTALGVDRSESSTLIGRNCKIKGEIIANEDVVIEGNVNGTIKVEKDLTINPNGNVKAQINVNSISVRGKIQGDIIAKSRVEILSSGSLEGNIKAPAIIIAEGSFFKGNVDMGRTVEEEEKRPAKPPVNDRISKLVSSPSPSPTSPTDKSKSEKKS